MVVCREGEVAEHGRYPVWPDHVFAVIYTLPYGIPCLVTPGRDGSGGLTLLFTYIYIVFKFIYFFTFLCFVFLKRSQWSPL